MLMVLVANWVKMGICAVAKEGESEAMHASGERTHMDGESEERINIHKEKKMSMRPEKLEL